MKININIKMKKAFLLLGAFAALQALPIMANTQVTATGQNDDPTVDCTMINNSTGVKETTAASAVAKPSDSSGKGQ